MGEPSPYKREYALHDFANESNPAKRACLAQPSLPDTWLTPSLSSVPSQSNSASPFIVSDSESPFPSFLDQAPGNEVDEYTLIGSSNDYDQCCLGEVRIPNNLEYGYLIIISFLSTS